MQINFSPVKTKRETDTTLARSSWSNGIKFCKWKKKKKNLESNFRNFAFYLETPAAF